MTKNPLTRLGQNLELELVSICLSPYLTGSGLRLLTANRKRQSRGSFQNVSKRWRGFSTSSRESQALALVLLEILTRSKNLRDKIFSRNSRRIVVGVFIPSRTHLNLVSVSRTVREIMVGDL